ncbi:uncharacterized protein PHALS_10665 [Plasmopara halstedii]|uniref:Temptin Cys/Cys disulfide domain-containing protein n=1 Tax=Plasmopara halstedii TaxID=4781 RepID=A0A0P1AIX8_PLAHL|nr:uncharacterized protein PHALS_10665 [Plasmopara halstedii]CEG40468.1 hypothetical protein PHALS_10665 [Plasmopara halstedii]|eukprot:XP_024576837.1 hypothetical protein PHALS_10665 [Plasmopara halstedii]
MVRAIFLTVVIFVAPSMVQSYAKYAELAPNNAQVPGNPNVGHLDPAGETGTSPFGDAFSKAGNMWSVALCQADTDNDGFTNGQELGDMCCTWVPGSTAGLITDGLSDPSDPSKTPTNAELQTGCSKPSVSANFSGSGVVDDTVGTVVPVGPSVGGLPMDDDEDDDSESAVVTAGTSTATSSIVVMGLAFIIALAVLL